jgi:hypothetical protein
MNLQEDSGEPIRSAKSFKYTVYAVQQPGTVLGLTEVERPVLGRRRQ